MAKTKQPQVEYQLGSNVVKVDGVEAFLDFVVWKEVEYKDIENRICK